MPISSPARILVADDHAVVREGLKSLIDREADLSVVAEASDGMQAIAAAKIHDVDLVILDVAMPGMTGLQATREIHRVREIPILLLSMYDREQYFFEALDAGAAGYVLKRQADRDIVDACRAALRGEPFIYPKAMSKLMSLGMGQGEGVRALLTPRETVVVKLIAEGHTSQQIADILTISPKTVERHRANILEKLGMRGRVELTRYAVKTGLIEP